MQPRFISPSLCPVFALAIPPPPRLNAALFQSRCEGVLSKPNTEIFGGMVRDDHWIPPSRASWPAIKALTLGEYKVGGGARGPHGHMLLIHLHTDRQSGHVTTIPNTPVPRPNLSQPPPHPQLTPGDPCSHLLQGSGTCWLAGGGGEWGEGRNWGSWIGDGRLRSF